MVFFSRKSKSSDSDCNFEIDFFKELSTGALIFKIIDYNNKLYPIDVKKSKGTLNSLEKFSNHNKFEYAIKVSKNNYGYNAEQKLLTVPFYFFPFVAEEFSNSER